MAIAGLTTVACADKTEFFCRMRDFLCKRNGTYDYSSTGIGYTLVDESYAVDEDNPAINDWYVMKFVGENSDYEFFIKVVWVSGYIAIHGGIYWNTTTNAFATQTDGGQYNCITMSETEAPGLRIIGDLDEVVVTLKGTVSNTTTYIATFGRLASVDTTNITEAVLTATSTYSSGSDVSITFNEALPADWAVDKGIFIWDGLGAAINVVTIKTLDGPTKTITADLTSNFANATVRASRHAGFFQPVSSASYPFVRAIFTANGATNQVLTFRHYYSITSANVGAANDSRDGFYFLSTTYQQSSYCFLGTHRYVKTAPVASSIPAENDILVGADAIEWRAIGVGAVFKTAIREA